MPPLLVIVGPTGVGKTRLAVQLALAFNGEIVNSDSRQVYRHMDIGTAKPTPEQRAQVPHHLIDIVEPDADFSLALYQKLAYQAITDIHQRGRLPLLVGGSGLYVWAVLEGWKIPEVAPDLDLRHKLEEQAGTHGAEQLYQELVRLDPEAAEKIDPRNIRRVIRALEVHARTGKPFSSLALRQAPGYESFIIGLDAPRPHLYRMVDRRVDEMFERGLVPEVENLIKIGYDVKLSSMSGIGYRQVQFFLRGEITQDEGVRQIKAETHRFIRHQYAWFRRSDPRICWFDVTESSPDEIRIVAGQRLRIAESI